LRRAARAPTERSLNLIDIGIHKLELEPPDLAITRVGGEVSVGDARAMAEALVAFAMGSDLFLLGYLDSPEAAVMSASARKAFIDGLRDVHLVGVAAVGGDFKARLLTRLVEAALRLLSRKPIRMRFFDDEPSARAWLRDQGCVACGATSVPDRSTRSS